MKAIKYVVTLVQGYDTMRFGFDDVGTASSFAKIALCCHETDVFSNGGEKGFQVSIELLPEGGNEDD
ncbi:hypothetical protein LI171_04845 [Emergencia timonensis]|uniref:hypothetical protein n=1 Tax=Emergencia timonensis TaxID=1776384 RepID=UPI001D092467|nr:hypothetical protein [Emergencia timonensis]MCB6475565.1 hypothetical protein [Emergencia timonensis]